MFFCLFQWLKDARFLSPAVRIDLLQNSATECLFQIVQFAALWSGRYEA
jgi:hypothetical protein